MNEVRNIIGFRKRATIINKITIRKSVRMSNEERETGAKGKIMTVKEVEAVIKKRNAKMKIYWTIIRPKLKYIIINNVAKNEEEVLSSVDRTVIVGSKNWSLQKQKILGKDYLKYEVLV